jgi:transcriptional regulator with XRE-family HTH domain
MFGEFVQERRRELELTLRDFCRKSGEDPSNWSKVERGLLKPPKTRARLKRVARALEITLGSDAWKSLVDMADVDAGKIPEYVMSETEVVKALPAFFRTVGSVKPTLEEVQALVDQLRESGKPQ